MKMELGPRKWPAHVVRDIRSPMQAPERARSIGGFSPLVSRPINSLEYSALFPALFA